MNQSGLSLMDKLRIELSVQRVDFVLDARVPRVKRRQIRNELRSNLTEAAQQVGVEAAIRQLGDLQALANSYLDLYRGRFDFRAGYRWAIIAYAAIQVLSLAIFFAFSTGVRAGGGHPASYLFWSGFGPFGGNAAAHSFELLLLSPAHMLIMAVAFAIGTSYKLILRR
jgi:hypothetical protein